ncbi:MAG: AI-2E family transporter [Burkholderiaceae bacterium]
MPFSFASEQKQAWFWLAVGLALVALLVLLSPILTPFIAAAILGYALNPGVDWIERRRIGRFHVPRALAVLTMILLLFAAILALLLIVVPIVQKEIPALQAQIPRLLDKLNAALSPRLQALGIDVTLDVDGIKKMLTERLTGSGDEALLGTLWVSAKTGGSAVIGWLGTLFLIPMVLFYLLLDWHQMLARIEDAIPRSWVARLGSLAREADALLAQYLRGQLLVMLILAIYYSTALAIAGFEIALPVGIITGFLSFIPYLGFGLGLTLALLAALLQFTGLYGLLAVAVVYSIGQVLESFILTPYLVGERIGLHPIIVIFALLAFGQLFGFVGVLLALPASAILSVAVRHMHLLYRSSAFYSRP